MFRNQSHLLMACKGNLLFVIPYCQTDTTNSIELSKFANPLIFRMSHSLVLLISLGFLEQRNKRSPRQFSYSGWAHHWQSQDQVCPSFLNDTSNILNLIEVRGVSWLCSCASKACSWRAGAPSWIIMLSDMFLSWCAPVDGIQTGLVRFCQHNWWLSHEMLWCLAVSWLANIAGRLTSLLLSDLLITAFATGARPQAVSVLVVLRPQLDRGNAHLRILWWLASGSGHPSLPTYQLCTYGSRNCAGRLLRICVTRKRCLNLMISMSYWNESCSRMSVVKMKSRKQVYNESSARKWLTLRLQLLQCIRIFPYILYKRTHFKPKVNRQLHENV